MRRREKTVVVFLSDHGYHVGEHFMYEKRTLFEESARVPFSIRYPGAKGNGKSSNSFVELVDIYPTLLELCGLPQPAQKLEGKSIVSILEQPNTSVRDAAYTVVRRGTGPNFIIGRSIRMNQWCYVEWEKPEETELYDLTADPKQFNNLSKLPDHIELIKSLSKKIKQVQPQ